MRTLEVKDGDLVISSGELNMVEGDLEIAQSVRMTMETAQGEWFLNPDFGMDREPLENKIFNEEAVRASIVEAATDDERIESVNDLVFAQDKSNRMLHVSLELQKTDGEAVRIEGVEL